MNDSEKVFNFGFVSILIAAFMVAIFQMAFSEDEKDLKKKNQTIVSLEQDLANATVKFSSLVEPQVLRQITTQIYPKYKSIGTERTITINNLENL